MARKRKTPSHLENERAYVRRWERAHRLKGDGVPNKRIAELLDVDPATVTRILKSPRKVRSRGIPKCARNEQIVTERKTIGPNGKPPTMEALAKAHKITRERVRQILARAGVK